MKIESAVISNIGKVRNNNEDNYFLDGIFREDVLEHEKQEVLCKEGKKFVFSVCDGMGGEANGEIASLCAVKALQVLKEQTWSKKSQQEFLFTAKKNMEMWQQEKKQDKQKMGTAIAILLLENNTGYAVNLGDSRLYLFREKSLQCLSKDHTQAQLLVEHGLLKKEEARTHLGGHVLTRFLGNDMELSVDDFYEMSPLKLKKDDIFLLCSDGLTDMLEDKSLEYYIKIWQKKPIKELAEALCQEALKTGGKDNITCLVVRIKKLENHIFGLEKRKEVGIYERKKTK